MHNFKSILLFLVILSEKSYGLTADEILALSPRVIYTKPFHFHAAFVNEKRFAFLSSVPNTMDTDQKRPIVTLVITEPAMDKIIETLELFQPNYENPLIQEPANKNKLEDFLAKYSIKIENLSDKLKEFPSKILNTQYSVQIDTINKNALKEGDSIEYILKLKKSDGDSKILSRFKHPIPCSNNLVAQQVLQGKPVRKFSRAELLGTCKAPSVLGYYLDSKQSQMVIVVEEYRNGGYFEGDIDWNIKRHLIGGKTQTGFKK